MKVNCFVCGVLIVALLTGCGGASGGNSVSRLRGDQVLTQVTAEAQPAPTSISQPEAPQVEAVQYVQPQPAQDDFDPVANTAALLALVLMGMIAGWILKGLTIKQVANQGVTSGK